MNAVRHLRGVTYHGRKGPVENSFRYSMDYVLLDMDSDRGPGLFSRNARNVTGVRDVDHGGAPGQGRGVVWVREVLAEAGFALPKIELLTQPRILGHVFNPVSFWVCRDQDGGLRVVIAEVSNTFGDRHSYLCHRDDRGVIAPDDVMTAQKIFHVSPFQPIAGGYTFRFDIRPDRLGIWIDHSNGEAGVYTTLTGALKPLTNAGILRSLLRRPFGSRRVLALIHWQAIKLAVKGAKFRRRPLPPVEEVSR